MCLSELALNSKQNTPAALGYRMPAEWEPHASTWLGWPHNRSDWPGKFPAIPWVYAEINRRANGVLSGVRRFEFTTTGDLYGWHRAVDGSLARLKLERIDVYQLHAPDPNVPFAESVGALAEAQRAGKIRHLGLSNVSVKELEEARRIVPIVSVQNEYNVGNRESEDVLEACARLGVAFIPWYPLGDGEALKSRKIRRAAAKLGATPAQVALAWLLAHSSAMLPIPGTSSIAHLEENTAAAALKLPPEDLAGLT